MTTLLFFGRLSDVAGCSQMACELPQTVTTVAALRAWLAARDPILGQAIQAQGVRVAVNRSICVFAKDVSPRLAPRRSLSCRR